MSKKVNALLSKRTKKENPSKKMAGLAKKSAEGDLNTFSGLFQATDLSDSEKTTIETILSDYTDDTKKVKNDLSKLLAITSEVKAINHQAILLHGERIQKAQKILADYREGAFSKWLCATYGNRQTPYNFLQYTQFYTSLPSLLQIQLEAMPRQAVYSLASREGDLRKKEKFVKNYRGETKHQLLEKIRTSFPLKEKDGRAENVGERLLADFRRLHTSLDRRKKDVRPTQKKALKLLAQLFIETLEE